MDRDEDEVNEQRDIDDDIEYRACCIRDAHNGVYSTKLIGFEFHQRDVHPIDEAWTRHIFRLENLSNTMTADGNGNINIEIIGQDETLERLREIMRIGLCNVVILLANGTHAENPFYSSEPIIGHRTLIASCGIINYQTNLRRNDISHSTIGIRFNTDWQENEIVEHGSILPSIPMGGARFEEIQTRRAIARDRDIRIDDNLRHPWTNDTMPTHFVGNIEVPTIVPQPRGIPAQPLIEAGRRFLQQNRTRTETVRHVLKKPRTPTEIITGVKLYE